MTTKEMMKEVRKLGNAPKDLGPDEETGISKAAAKFVKEANARSEARNAARSVGASTATTPPSTSAKHPDNSL